MKQRLSGFFENILFIAVFAAGFMPGTHASADFERPSPDCLGATELVGGTVDQPGAVLDVFLPAGQAATCVANPPGGLTAAGGGSTITNLGPLVFEMTGPANQFVNSGTAFGSITGDGAIVSNSGELVSVSVTGNGAQFTNSATGTGLFGVTGDAASVVNSGDIRLELGGNAANITNNADGTLAGNIFGNATTVLNNGSLPFMTIEGDSARVTNNGTSGQLDVEEAIGFLIIGEDAEVTNNGTGRIEARGLEAIAVGIQGTTEGGKITNNGGTIKAEGTESLAAGIEGDGAEITNGGTLEVVGLEGLAAAIEGDEGKITNNSMVTATGEEASGMFIEGNDGEITNDGEVMSEGKFSLGMAIDGADAKLTNNVKISTKGNVTVGMGALGDGATATNNGTIETEGENAFGIGVFGQDATIENKAGAEINTNGTGSHAIILGHENAEELSDGAGIPPGAAVPSQGTITNDGDLTTFGDDSDGIHAFANNSTINNNNTITTTGETSHAIAAIGDDITVNQDGEIETSGTSADAINIRGDDATVNNTKEISTTRDQAAGIAVTGTGATIINGEDGTVSDTGGMINTTGVGSFGIALGRQSTEGASPRSGGDVKNFGKIETTGRDADGIHAFADGGEFENHNEIKTTGDQASGINVLGDGGDITNLDEISTEGEGSSAIKARGQNITIANGAETGEGTEASIETMGDSAHGIEVLPESTVPFAASEADITNFTSIETAGEGAHGVLAAIDDSKIENKGDISATGDSAHAISTRGDDVEIVNSGALEAGDSATTTADNIGINFNPGTDGKTTVTNEDMATVTVHGTNARGIAGGQARGADESEVINKNRIEVTGENVVGVELEGDKLRVINGQTTTTGTENAARTEVRSETGMAQGILTEGNGVFASNRGVLSVEGSDATAIGAKVTGANAAFTENADRIVVRGSNATGISVSSANAAGIAVADSFTSDGDCLGLSRGAQVLNCGSIDLEGENATGLQAEGLKNAVVENDNTIATNGASTGARGMVVERAAGGGAGSSDDNILFNFGDIELQGDGSKGVVVDGTNNIFINNNGVTRFFAGSGFETVISVMQDTLTSKNGVDDSSLNRQANILVDGAGAVGLDISGDNNSVGLNIISDDLLSTIRATGAGSIGIRMSGNSNTVVNDGIVAGEIFGVLGGEGRDIVQNQNTIEGDVNLQGGDDDFTLLAGGQVDGVVDAGEGRDFLRMFADINPNPTPSNPNPPDLGPFIFDGDDFLNFENFSFDSTIKGELEDDLVLDDSEGATRASITVGELEVTFGARLEATEIFVSQNGKLSGRGTISTRPIVQGGGTVGGRLRIEDDGTLGPGSSPGTLTVLGDFELAGLLEIEIAGLAEGMFDQLIVEGDFIADGGVIGFSFLDFLPEVDDFVEFLIVTGNVVGFESLSFTASGLPAGFDFDVSLLQRDGGGFGFGLTATEATSVPEPGTLTIFVIGLGGLAVITRRRRPKERPPELAPAAFPNWLRR